MNRTVVTLIALGLAISASSVCGDEPDDIVRLKAQIEVLKKQLNEVEDERDELQTKVEELTAKKPVVKKKVATPAAANKVVAPLGSKWKGLFGNQAGEMSVQARNGKKMTLRIEIETGAIWDFDCTFVNSREYVIDQGGTKKVRASKGVSGDGPPVGGVNGEGRISGKNITHNYKWPAGSEPSKIYSFNGKLVEPTDKN